MILVITKDGNVYINEKAVVSVNHSRKLKTALITLMGDNMGSKCIDHVEQIRYISDNADVCIDEDGGELNKLRKDYDRVKKYADVLRYMNIWLMDKYPDIYEQLNSEAHNKFKDYFNNGTSKVNPGD